MLVADNPNFDTENNEVNLPDNKNVCCCYIFVIHAIARNIFTSFCETATNRNWWASWVPLFEIGSLLNSQSLCAFMNALRSFQLQSRCQSRSAFVQTKVCRKSLTCFTLFNFNKFINVANDVGMLHRDGAQRKILESHFVSGI